MYRTSLAEHSRRNSNDVCLENIWRSKIGYSSKKCSAAFYDSFGAFFWLPAGGSDIFCGKRLLSSDEMMMRERESCKYGYIFAVEQTFSQTF